ncbi:YraN family protein [Collinsella sp. AGMB00827]|uniref:UPF0102 protein K6V98_06765 n=1 Tax=Collinsella ureilytica TaxID=2869515 RepID=A0ABS7ML03_9ACTN|nr:YraN family protein [Collinsella urealyticum]MBY4798044.1 YraN family protein [Collinsella urealyticum]
MHEHRITELYYREQTHWHEEACAGDLASEVDAQAYACKGACPHEVRQESSRGGARQRDADDLAGEDPTDRACDRNLNRSELGRLGEDLAAEHLRSLGFVILERNYRCCEGEADLVALDPDDTTVVLVEVKTRRTQDSSEELFVEEAVDARKRQRYRRIASAYLMSHYPVVSIRFDVVAITIPLSGEVEIFHIPNAFGWEAE